MSVYNNPYISNTQSFMNAVDRYMKTLTDEERDEYLDTVAYFGLPWCPLPIEEEE